jgi:hypothetical protein
MRGRESIFVTLLLLLPTAAAGSVRGDFTTQSEVAFSEGTAVSFAPQALYTGHPDAVTLRARFLHVTIYERRDANVDRLGQSTGISGPNVQTSPVSERSYYVSDATVTAAPGAGPGFVGAYLQGKGQMRFNAGEDVTTRPSAASAIPEGTTGRPDPALPFYHVDIAGPHLDLGARGLVVCECPAALKIMGSEVTIRAHENTTTLQTGTFPANPLETTKRWLYLSWETGDFALNATGMVEAAATDVASFAAGAVVFVAKDVGEMRTSEVQYTAQEGDPVQIVGTLAGTLATLDGSIGRLHVDGEVASTSLHPVPLPPVPIVARSGLLLWLGLAVVGLVAAGGVMAVLRRPRVGAVLAHRSRVGAWERELAEDYGRRGLEAADNDDFHASAELHERASRSDPTQGDYPLREGTARFQLRQFERAIGAFERAMPLRGDGEPEWWAAQAAMALGNDDLAETYILRALERDASAWVLHGLMQDPALRGILEKPEVRALLDAARRRHGLSGL